VNWILGLFGLGVAVAALSGPGDSLTRWRPRKPFRRARFKPFALPKGARGRAFKLPTGWTRFGGGHVEGNVGETETSQIVTFDLGELPDGNAAYVVRVTFNGPDTDGSGLFRLRVDQKRGVATIVMGGIMPPYDAGGDDWRLLRFQLAEYLVDKNRGTVGFAGFHHGPGGRVYFSVSGIIVPPTHQAFSDNSGPYHVAVDWTGMEFE
jgi:hypothetical protein